MNKLFRETLGLLLCLLATTAGTLANDTIWLQVDTSNQIFFNHHINDQETLYSISKKYGVELQTLVKHNNLQHYLIASGDNIKVPVERNHIDYYCNTDGFRSKSNEPILCYKIKPGDNLFHLSKRVFDTEKECLLKQNDIAEGNIAIDQIISLGYWKTAVDHSNNEESTETEAEIIPTTSLEDEFWFLGKGKNANQNSGAAFVQEGTEDQPTFVLFDGVDIGTVVKLYHKGTEKTVYCRVVGAIPAKMRAQNLIIVTELVQEKLGLKEKRFNIAVEFFKKQ